MIKRIYFEKKDEMKYISHRDFLRFLERLFKISKLDIEYSNGFHPRPRMSFGKPISIGEEVSLEPMDILFKKKFTNESIISNLNRNSSKGFKVLDSIDIDGKSSIISTFNSLLYHIEFINKNDKDKFIDFLSSEKIIETREKNKRLQYRDLKVNLVSIKDVSANSVEIILNNVSPNSFIRLSKINVENIIIKRIKYLNT